MNLESSASTIEVFFTTSLVLMVLLLVVQGLHNCYNLLKK